MPGLIFAHLGLTPLQSLIVLAVCGLFLILWLWVKLNWRRAAAIAWSTAIFAGLSLPSNDIPDLSGRDKVVHALIFAGFAYLWRLAGWSERRTLLWSVGYAVLSEVYQALMPIGRSGDWEDALADLVGALVGLLLTRLLSRFGLFPRS